MKIFNLKFIFFILILLNVFLASRWVIDGNLFFHTDIARDFLLIEDILDNKNLTLIGPRSGAIPGLFHGPLWLYLNLPAFLIGGGDPVFVGWFWVVLYILSLFITYFVAKRMFGEKEGLLSALLLSSVTILQVRSLFNPYGALLLAPIFFYFFYNYLQTKKIKALIIALFALGLTIQFQMAFGIPILILTFLYLVYYLIKQVCCSAIKINKVSHLISFLILLIPLSTYILFELRNKFLQIKSVFSYLLGNESHGNLDLNYVQLILLRSKEMVTDGLGSIVQNNVYLTIGLILVIVFAFYKITKEKKFEIVNVFMLFIYFYLGFWIFTVFFKGPVWNYYFMPFIPLIIIIFVSLRKIINKKIFYTLFILIFLSNEQIALSDIFNYSKDLVNQDVSTWKFNQLIAKEVFSGSEKQFGYFIFTPDLYGYSPRYALNLYQKRNKQKRVNPYQKENITYLVIAPPPEYGKDPNSIWYQKNTNSASWRSNDIRIYKKPANSISFKNGFVIEKYDLSDEEVKVAPNPYLIKDIFFR